MLKLKTKSKTLVKIDHNSVGMATLYYVYFLVLKTVKTLYICCAVKHMKLHYTKYIPHQDHEQTYQD